MRGNRGKRGQAAREALAIPEILTMILANLKRVRTDLLATSRVSNLFRQASLPLLLGELDLPLTQVQAFVQSFHRRRSRPLLEHVKYLRIWDDDTHKIFRHRDGAAPQLSGSCWQERNQALCDQHPDKEQHDARWSADVNALFDLLTMSRKQPLPLIDISFGVISARAINGLLREYSELAARVAALRVLYQPVFQYAESNAEWWAALGDLVEAICTAQDQAKCDSLKLFAVEAYTTQIPQSKPKRQTWAAIADRLSRRVEDLILHLPENIMSPHYWPQILGLRWHRLRRFRLKFDPGFILPQDDTQWVEWDRVLQFFLHHHRHLEEVHLGLPWEMPPFIPTSTCPELKRASFHVAEPKRLPELLSRFPNLVDLAITDYDDPAVLTAPASFTRVSLGPNALQTVRGSTRLCSAFAFSGAQVAHLDIRSGLSVFNVREIGRYEAPSSSAASTAQKATCLSMNLDDDYEDALVQLGVALHPSAYPNLTELVLRCDCASPPDLNHDKNAEPLWRLRRVLLALGACPKLRVVHVELGRAFPLQDVVRLNDPRFQRRMPPSLEFVSWYSAMANQTQYYRALPASREQLRDWPDALRQFYPMTSPPQALVDERGVWDHTSDLEEATKILLDHSVFPPRLRA